MSNFFDEISKDASKIENEILGPDYKYWDKIKTPGELGITGQGSISSLAKDVKGIINYVELLVTGDGDAKKTLDPEMPLGDRFFMKTGGKCKDVKSGELKDRYMFINNIPDGSIPFISSGLDINFTAFEGLIPGIMTNLAQLNPMAMLKGFMEGSEPDCQEITMDVVSTNTGGVLKQESQFVPITEIKEISPCDFPDNTNPATKKKCEGMLNMSDVNINMSDVNKLVVKKPFMSPSLKQGIQVREYDEDLNRHYMWNLQKVQNETQPPAFKMIYEKEGANGNLWGGWKELNMKTKKHLGKGENIFYFIVGLFLVYLLYKIMNKKR